jgi:hypothetical protein
MAFAVILERAPAYRHKIKNKNGASREEVISKKLLFVKRSLDEQWPVDLCDNVL